MNSSYRFTSDTEPTDLELESLMKDVIIDVKKRAKKADIKFQKLQKLQIIQAIQRQKLTRNGTI